MNDIKPLDNRCPKCDGFYVWEAAHRCLCCGYVYNPRMEPNKKIRLHCTWGACLKPLDESSGVYCEKHRDGQITNQALVRRKKQLLPASPRYLENQLYLNRPIPVRPVKNDSIEYEGS